MGRLTKIILALIAALVGLFAVAAIAFLLFFDPNDFREDVEKVVMDSTGRKLTIEGDVSLQLFPWLAVEVGKATLGNAPGFGDEPFAELERAELSVQFWPLILERAVAVGTAEIDGLTLNLAVDASNKDNWSDLAASETDEHIDDTSTDTDDGTLAISGVAVRNATITYTNAANGGTYSLSEADLEIGSVSGDAEAVTIDGVAFDGVISGVADAPSRMAVETAGIELDVAGNIATIQPVELSIFGIAIDAALEPLSYAGTVQPKAAIEVSAFSPRSVMTLFGVEPPETADPVALSSITISAHAAVGDTAINLTDIEFKVDDTRFTGSLSLPLGDGGGFRFDLNGDAIDLNRYMAPASEEAAVDPGDTAPVEIPADLVRALNASGKMKLTSVVLGRLQLDNVTLGLNSSGGRMRLHPVAADLYGGTYNGDVRIDASASTPVLSVHENVSGVDLGKLVAAMFQQENITGSIDGNFKLTGKGSDLADVQRSLSGTMSFELKDGAYEGTDVWYELRRARALLKQETPPEPVLPARTKFSSVTATGVVTDGIMRNEDFVAFLPFIQLNGKGNVNIPDGTIDYRMTARVFKKPESPAAATPEELEDFTKTVVPIRISGPLASAKPVPDVEQLLRQEVEEEIQEVEEEIKDAIEDKLKDLLKR